MESHILVGNQHRFHTGYGIDYYTSLYIQLTQELYYNLGLRLSVICLRFTSSFHWHK